MLKELLCFAVALVAVQATGDFVVLHSPDSVVFSGSEEVEQSLLKEVLAAALGYTVKHRGLWSGMSITNPFQLPEAVVALAFEGMESFNLAKGERFPLRVNEVEETTWQALRERVDKRDCDNTLVRIFLADGIDALGQSALGELKPPAPDETSLKALSLKRDEDKKFVEEIQLLLAIAKKVPTAIKPDSKPDIYWLVLSGMGSLLDRYGTNSTEAREAQMLLNNALNAINDAFVQAYDGKVIITAFTNDASQVRHSRSVLLNRQTRDADALKIENLSKNYNEDYPVIFNIILWFGVAFFFSLLAVCIAIADMDPGRDSIIYRMTSNRMKKDN